MTKRCLYCGRRIEKRHDETIKRYKERKFCSNRCSVHYRLIDSTPEIERVVEYRYYCELCGEDRQHMFVKTKKGVRCGVCGYPAEKEEIVFLAIEEEPEDDQDRGAGHTA